MSVAGNSFEETIGMVTAGTEIMVGQPAKVGRGLRTIAINISKLAQEQETLSVANGKYTISLQDQDGQMRSTYDIMSQLGDIWENLNETEQTALATQLAGKTQFEVFSNVMKNWGSAVEATNTALDSNGSSMRENEKYLDSIEGKIQAFRSAWEQLSFHLVNSDLIKDVVDLGTKIITVIDNIVQKIGALPTALGALGVAFGAKKLLGMAEGFLGISKGIEGVTEGTKTLANASQVASGAQGVGGLSKSLGLLTNPAVIGGVVALGAAIAAIEIDKYFSFDSSLKRLNQYSDKLKTVTDEIEALKEKRDSAEGLTSAEKTHLAVLEAEERSLERQIELENQRVKKAFQRDATTNQGKRYQERTGPTQLLDYTDAYDKQIKAYEKVEGLRKQIAEWNGKADAGLITPEESALLEKAEGQLQDAYDDLVQINAETAEAGFNLSSYYEQVKDAIPYDEMDTQSRKVFDEMHRGFLQSQIDANNLEDDFTDVSGAFSNILDSFSGETLDLFDDIDISSFETVDDVVDSVSEKINSLDDDAEITFEAKDETGNVIGQIEGKKGDLTNDEWTMILRAQATGDWSKVEEYTKSGKASKDFTSVVTVEANASEAEGKKKEVSEPVTTDVEFNPTNTGTINSYRSTFGTPITTTVNFKIGTVPNKPKFASGKRKGENGGLAWLGDEGSRSNPKPELVVGEDGAYLAGTKGWELHTVKKSDTVYSYSDTKKLLNGKQSFVGAVGEIPRYKEGTKKKKRKEFDKKLDKLKHKQKVNHWTDKKFQSEYSKLYKKYKKWLSKDQKWERSESREDYQNERDKDKFEKLADDISSYDDLKKFKTKVNANKNLSADEKAELIQDAGNKYYSNEFDRRLGNLAVRGAGKTRLTDFVKDVNANAYLSEHEKKEQLKKAYKNVAEYNLKAYENGQVTRDKTLQSINDYYKQVGKKDEDYYKMLDDLREADQEKEVKRLKELEEQQENKLNLAQKYLNKELKAIEKQIDAQKEEKEAQEKLVELQNELNKAKSTSIRIYKEGVGFVYEQDTEAIKEAQKAYDDYIDSQSKTDLEKRAEKIRAVLELFSDLEDASEIHELELKLGVNGINNLTGGNFGTDISQWTNWIKGVIARQVAYADLGNKIGDLKDADIDKWLGDVLSSGEHQVSDTTLSSYISQHSFASGTLSAPGGLSRIGELGGELVWLGKGDSVYSNRASRNLMEWGRYNPAQVLSSNHNSSSSQIFNFDKIVLPNVRNAEDFYRELQKLPNMAIQQSARR